MGIESGQSVIKIQRRKQLWTKGSNFRVFIDGKMVRDIGLDSEEFLVEPGPHKVLIKMGWSKSNEINVHANAGETTNLICGNNELMLNSLFVLIFIQFFSGSILKPFHLSFQMERRIEIFYFIITPIIVILITFIQSAMVYLTMAEPKESNNE